MTSGQKLLAEYVQSSSEAAFRELVTRYLGLVYSAVRAGERRSISNGIAHFRLKLVIAGVDPCRLGCRICFQPAEDCPFDTGCIMLAE